MTSHSRYAFVLALLAGVGFLAIETAEAKKSGLNIGQIAPPTQRLKALKVKPKMQPSQALATPECSQCRRKRAAECRECPAASPVGFGQAESPVLAGRSAGFSHSQAAREKTQAKSAEAQPSQDRQGAARPSRERAGPRPAEPSPRRSQRAKQACAAASLNAAVQSGFG